VADELVLIIEDNPRNLKLARDVLSFHGFHTVEAENAKDGLLLAELRLPDVILMDIQLPDMDGITALQRLRSLPATSTIPVVALTAFAMDHDRVRILAAGFDGYLVKPIDIKRFSDQVRQYCVSR
jgi:two-component system, cell cycle response regulator DivK